MKPFREASRITMRHSYFRLLQYAIKHKIRKISTVRDDWDFCAKCGIPKSLETLQLLLIQRGKGRFLKCIYYFLFPSYLCYKNGLWVLYLVAEQTKNSNMIQSFRKCVFYCTKFAYDIIILSFLLPMYRSGAEDSINTYLDGLILGHNIHIRISQEIVLVPFLCNTSRILF